jgi:hypothetical protein
MREVVAVYHHFTDQRIDDMDGDVRVRQIPAVEEFTAEVDYPDLVSLRCWPQRAFPNADPSGFRGQEEFRK